VAIKVKILPDNNIVEINRDEITVEELLNTLDIRDLDAVSIIVNETLIDNLKHVLRSSDKIIVIIQAIGG